MLGVVVPVSTPTEAALAAVSDAILGVAGERSVEAVLQRLVVAARELAGARYAALGIPDEEGDGFAQFLTAGMDDELIDAIGPLPRTHGLLGSLLVDPTPYRSDDVAADPRFTWWPEAHPRMGAFLGMPLLFKGDVIGALYLADKDGGGSFDEADERLMGLLAAHAAVAIEQARLVEASRELSILEERARLARELHDATVQTLFSLSLSAEVAASLLEDDPAGAAAELGRIRELSQAAVGELRTLVFELRPPALDDGLVATLGKRLEVLSRTHGLEVSLVAPPSPSLDPETETGLIRIVQEALTNVGRHAAARRVEVVVGVGDHAVDVTVTDDGTGFEPEARAIRARRLGLTSMRERASALEGTLAVESSPGRGTTVRVSVPRRR
ncbi:MAG TPA: GAF domain-containing sensor histidine kinase [Acidimicrobiales bacterium]|jgi:signal transduction histidine kinase|nr:GAF domain-containing sensor histidine kinase [Acidimicrobiales bacterium]